MITDDLHGLYSGGWKNLIVPEAFGHPAKFSRKLIEFLYKHAIEEGWVKSGDVCLDCFGGVGLGALDAMRNGLVWVGCELENRFCQLGQQNIDLWNKRYSSFPNWGKAYLLQGDSRHLIEVVQKADIEISSPPYADSIKPNGDGIDWSKIKGEENRENNRTNGRGAIADGYSNNGHNLGNMKDSAESFSAAISSPPYVSSLDKRSDNERESDRQHIIARGGNPDSVGNFPMGDYGNTEGQLANMKEGNIDISLSSPPFLQTSGGTNVTATTGVLADERLIKRHSAGNQAANGYGDDPANLGNMPVGNLALSSPPFVDRTACKDPNYETNRKNGGGPLHGDYGDTPGNLGNMPTGDLVLSSPPYADIAQSGGTKGLKEHGTGLTGDGICFSEYGNDPAQLGKMQSTEDGYSLAVSSPPYADSLNVKADPQAEFDRIKEKYDRGEITGREMVRSMQKGGFIPNSQISRDRKYGEDPANLGNMKDNNFDLAVSSPPYSETRISGNGDEGSTGLRNEDGTYLRGSEGWEKRKELGARYGNSEGNLGNLKDAGLDVSISSPPFSEPNNQPCIGQGVRKDLESIGKNPTARYGGTEGNLGNMDMGVSSPPFEDNIGNDSRVGNAANYTGHKAIEYAPTNGNLGGNTGNDFWSAARLIVEQVYTILKPNAYSIWVVKSYIKKGRVVDFPDQWRLLCEAVGFKTVHIHRAWLVEEKGAQYDLFGETHVKRIERKSFFRRLAEKKGSPRIDYEQVICMQKPE